VSAHKQVLLYCDSDEDECPREGEMFDGGGFYSSVSTVREIAKRSGWSRSRGKDYCDDCTKKRKGTPT
jgi:hypothetical protein